MSTVLYLIGCAMIGVIATDIKGLLLGMVAALLCYFAGIIKNY